MHRAYASFDKTKKGSMQQRELADLRSAFLVSEETTPADNLGNLRGHHLVPGFVPVAMRLITSREKIGRYLL